MLNLTALLDTKDAAKALEVTTKNLRDTVRRGMGVTAEVVAKKTSQAVREGESRPYFQRRKVGLTKQYYRLTRLRFNWRGPESIVGETQAKSAKGTEMASAIELGGKYTQFVKPFTRRRAMVFGRKVAPFTEQVVGAETYGPGKRRFLRQRTERARRYLLTSVDVLGDRVARPLTRALQILVNEKRVPKRSELFAEVGP